VLAARGTLRAKRPSARPSASAPLMLRGSDHVTAVAEVVSLEGPRGTIAVELSLLRVAREQRSVQHNALVAGIFALLLGVGGASWIARSISRRLRGIADVADAVAGGNLEHPPLEADTARDEISTVAAAFNTMLDKIRSLIAAMQQAAREEQERLEALVLARTAELNERNADMKRILENVGQGFFTLDLAGRMSRERSAVLERWFGPAPESASFCDLVTRADPAVGDWFAVAWEGLCDGILPLELSLDQLPKRLSVGEFVLELDYRPILRAGGELERVLVVVSDVTARLKREQAEAHEREMTKLFVRASTDRAGLLEFLAESSAQVEYIGVHASAKELAPLKRALHTLKGNSAIYGVETVSALCHTLEDRLAEAGKLDRGVLAALRDRWSALNAKLGSLVAVGGTKVEIEEGDFQAILAALEGGAPRAEAILALRRLRLEPSELRLGRLAEQAVALGERIGKNVEVRTDSADVRLKADEWSEFFNASIHVLRNSIDHGLELPEDRRAHGKPDAGRIELRTSLDREHFRVEFSDDGRGIDWTGVERQARRLGLPTTTEDDLIEALFADGLSTRQGVSELSGRGVGLGAVRQACRALGGDVEIESTQGLGTTFRFVWPAQVVTRHFGPLPSSPGRAAQPAPTQPHEETQPS
jgi:two-component system chemotaxis sensor kinase CheA